MHKQLLNREWIEPAPVAVSPALTALLGPAAPPVVARILASRGLADPDAARAFLDPAYYRPAPAVDLPGMEAAVALLTTALAKGDRIAVWGDYDVDGQTSTALLVGILRDLGGDVIFHIPIRAQEPHGVNIEALMPLLESGAKLLLTCDTGIASHAAVEYAEARGVPVIVTDHHDLPEALPRASVVVNPKLLNSTHALATLPGVGVAYKLAEALYDRAARAGGADAYLDLVALGIVADVADILGDTRYLLQRGLRVLRTRPRPAVAAMLNLAGLQPAGLNEGHIGFTLGPQLNAIGRLADANPVVDFLNTTDAAFAQRMAAELARLNVERRRLTTEVLGDALAMLNAEPALLDNSALVLAKPDWPAGILGIVAARLVEQFGKPVVLLTMRERELAHGSARSVPGCDITAALQAQPDLLVQSGGHQQAAGLSIQQERIGELRVAVSRAVTEQLGDGGERPPLTIDAFVRLNELTLPLVDGLERLAPFGAGFRPPVLAARGLVLESRRIVGKSAEHLALVVTDATGARTKIMLWNGVNQQLPEGRFDLAFTVQATSYRGERQVQVEWVEARPFQPVAGSVCS